MNQGREISVDEALLSVGEWGRGQRTQLVVVSAFVGNVVFTISSVGVDPIFAIEPRLWASV
jgi:hypothetical protein